MHTVRRLFIHCTGTYNGRITTLREVDMWHAARCSPRWEKDAEGRAVYTPADMSPREEAAVARFNSAYPYVGYHGLILLDGRLHYGRAEQEAGSHAAGHNSDSLAYCLVGTDKFTPAQWFTLREVVEDVRRRYGNVEIVGHNEYSKKLCPGFDVGVWLDNDLVASPAHTYGA
jgi:N-acetylmuramoyl-L-alanine amidase